MESHGIREMETDGLVLEFDLITYHEWILDFDGIKIN